MLLAISRERKLVGAPFTVPIGGNHVLAGEVLWERLDTADPIPDLKIV